MFRQHVLLMSNFQVTELQMFTSRVKYRKMFQAFCQEEWLERKISITLLIYPEAQLHAFLGRTEIAGQNFSKSPTEESSRQTSNHL